MFINHFQLVFQHQEELQKKKKEKTLNQFQNGLKDKLAKERRQKDNPMKRHL